MRLPSESGNCATLHLRSTGVPSACAGRFSRGVLSFSSLSDALVAGGCIRPTTLLAGLKHGTVSAKRLPVALLLTISGLVVEPFAWLQSLLFHRRIQACRCPDDPVVVIGHWRSGTTYLHQLLSADPSAATARNQFIIAPQAALILKPLLNHFLRRVMTQHRPIDAVSWGPEDPQEDEVGLARLTMDSHMSGIAFPQDYPRHFRRTVLHSSTQFERHFLQFTRLTWLYEGAGKTHLVIKNSVHTARIALLLRLFPRARFVYLYRRPLDSVRSLVQVKQRLARLVGLQLPPSSLQQVEETAAAHRQLQEAYERSKHLIPPGQLIEVAYDDLVQSPQVTLERIYRSLQISGWSTAQPAIEARIAKGKMYQAEPVVLEPEAEQRLRALLS